MGFVELRAKLEAAYHQRDLNINDDEYCDCYSNWLNTLSLNEFIQFLKDVENFQ
jgi:hypothetical protein